MLFDVQAALADILAEPVAVATPATPATNPAEHPPLSRMSRVSQSPDVSTEEDASVMPLAPSPASIPSQPDAFPYGTSPGGRPLTVTGRVVSLDAWRSLTDWERHGARGRIWNGRTRRWERGEEDRA